MTSADGNNGVGPLSDPVSVNAPQMGDKRRRPILPTKRDTTEKKGSRYRSEKSISAFLSHSLSFFLSISCSFTLSKKEKKEKKS